MNDIIYPKIPINFYPEKETNEENPACVNSALLIKDNKVHVIKISKLYSRSSDQPLEFEYVQYDVSDFFETVQQSESIQKSLNNNNRSVLKKIFPTATRFITEDGSIIIERPPFRHTIDFTPVKASKVNKKSSKKIEPITVWVPWTVYKMNINKQGHFTLTIHFNDSSISSLNDHIFPCLFPNVFSGGLICFGTESAHNIDFVQNAIKDDTYSYKELFNYIISNYYNGGWNTDILPNSHEIPMFMMFQSYDRIKALNDPKALEIYSNAMAKCNPVKHKDNYIAMYLNALNIWSVYSLEELLYLFKHCVDTISLRQMVSLSSLINVAVDPRAFRYSSNEIDDQLRKMMIKPNYHAYKQGVTILRYDKDPISGQQYPSSGNILQEDLHQMLNNIIAHEDSKNSSVISFEEKS
jgi:hypothetical protein